MIRSEDPSEHPAWWIEHLEHLEAIDRPGGVAYGASVGLRAPVIMSLARRGLVTASIQVVDVQNGGGQPERLSFPWVKLTDQGRRVFERDLPPPTALPIPLQDRGRTE